MALNLKIVLGSTRPGRISPIIGEWIASVARENPAFDVEIVDLKELGLPLLDEAGHPRAKQYEHEHTKRWSALADEADAFIFVTPEYDSFPPAALINALQCLSLEWDHKAAAVVSYGGVSGGLRAMQELRMLIANLNMMPIPQSIPMPFVFGAIGDDSILRPEQPVIDGAEAMLAELAVWGEALKPIRG